MTHQWLPEVYLSIPDSVWPNTPPLPLGTGRVGDFTVEREIVAANMPGQVRARSGFSIGNAEASIRQTDGRPLAPWASTDRRVTTGQPCSLYAEDETTGERHSLGSWKIQTPAGALSRADVSVGLIESQYGGRRNTDPRLPTIRGPVDGAWIVDQLARRAGFYSTPKPTASTLLSVPLCGTSWPEVGTQLAGASSDARWSTALGRVCMDNDPTVRPRWSFTPPETPGFRFAADSPGAVLRFQLPSTKAAIALDVIAWAHGQWHMRINDGPWTNGSWTPGLHAGHPFRYEVDVAHDGVNIRARIRSTDTDTAWSSWLSVARGVAEAEARPFAAEIQWQASKIAGLQVGVGPMSWAPPTARIPLLDATVDAPWLPTTKDVWTALQTVCDSFAAAGWVSLDALLTVRNRHEMAGSDRPKTLVEVAERVEDLAWTLDADDYADRLEVTYWPVTWPDGFTDPSAWEGVGGKLHVPAGTSVTFRVDLDGYVGQLGPWAPLATATVDSSEWEANTTADGSGPSVSEGITVTTDQTSPATARVTVTNGNTTDVWMVDFQGNPAMVLRGTGAASQEASQTIVRGVAEIDAEQPLQIDLGKLVQSRDVAEELTSFLWERVNTPRYRLSGVRMPLDWDRDLGDILTLSHPDSQLSATVLVVRDAKSGTEGEIEHRNDLILLPPTWDDFDAAWAGKTWDDFDAAWAGKTWTQFDNDPLNTEA